MKSSSAVAVIGLGSWGSALAILLSGGGARVRAWEYDPVLAAAYAAGRREPALLPGVRFPAQLQIGGSLDATLEGADFVVLAVPSHALRELLPRLAPGLAPDAVLVDVAKGIEQLSLRTPSGICAELLPHRDPRLFTCLSGPSLAGEVARGVPTAVVAAGTDEAVVTRVQQLFSGESFRVYRNEDLTGVELGGALKNVIALAAGMVDGLGFGDNTKGALLTRGMVELSRLGTALGGRPETFWGLSGMGDLITTCSSPRSRNRFVGEELGRGRRLEEILAGMEMVAEGVRTADSAWRLARRESVPMPITAAVRRILFEQADPRTEVVALMTRRLKAEEDG
jgi:glycerol-3-phosphate dehydrogenase (NAD(P)+)